MTLVWAPSFSTQVSDPDAQAYIEAVETQDTQPLEVGVAHAINTFVLGCKADGIWDAIKASCILAGARTLAGALVPLKGAAPTNNNFVSGDYNRETGLVGDGSTKYLNSNRNNNADPQDSNHNAVAISSVGSGPFLGVVDSIANGANSVGTVNVRSRSITASTTPTTAIGFCGISRSSSASFLFRNAGTTTTIARVSEAPQSSNMTINRSAASYGSHRLSFYSIGESLDLAALDNRVTTLMTDIGAAIP
jgi:hypothetical protein